jgi:hypothetical protein
MLNLSVLEAIQILKGRRSHFELVAAGLASMDDRELPVSHALLKLQAGRADDADFEGGPAAASSDSSSESESIGARLIMKQLDAALVQLRECMFDGMGDGKRIISDVREARARKAVSEVDPRLLAVPLFSQLQLKSEAVAESEIDCPTSEDQRVSRYALHLKLRRQADLPPSDATSTISVCIPGWGCGSHAPVLQTTLSPSSVPSFVQAVQTSEPCVYGARRREASTWRQKHKR